MRNRRSAFSPASPGSTWRAVRWRPRRPNNPSQHISSTWRCPTGPSSRSLHRRHAARSGVYAGPPGYVPIAFDMAPFAESTGSPPPWTRWTRRRARRRPWRHSRSGLTARSQAALAKLPAGTVQYSFVSSSSGNGNCSRSVQLTSFGPDQPPKVVSQSSGDCAGVGTPSRPSSAMPRLPPAPGSLRRT